MNWQNFIYGLLIIEGKSLKVFIKKTKINPNTINNYLKNKTQPYKKYKTNLIEYSKKFEFTSNEICRLGKKVFFLNKGKNWALFFKGLQIATGLTSEEFSKELKIGYNTFLSYRSSRQKPHNDYRILKNLFKFIEKQEIDINYALSIGKINWNKEIIKIMKELKLSIYAFSKLFPTLAENDIIRWIKGIRILNYQSLNKILRIKEMLDQKIDKRKILFYINKESFLNNKLRLKLYLMRKYYLNMGQIEIENLFKRVIMGVEAGSTPISKNKFQEFKDKFNTYFIKKYKKTSDEIEKEIENKIKLKSFNEINQWDINYSNKIVNFDSKDLTNQEKKVSNLFKKLGFDVFLHPILVSEDLVYKKQCDCYVTQNKDEKMNMVIECKDTNFNKFKDNTKKIITEILTLKNKILPKLVILITNGFTNQEYNLLVNNKVLPITNQQIKIFYKNPNLLKKQINNFLKSQPISNNFIPKTYSQLKKWRNLNHLSREEFIKLLKIFNIHICHTHLYEKEITNQALSKEWIKCLASLEGIKKEKGLRYIHKITKNNLLKEFDSVIGTKKAHPLGKSLEIKCRNYLRNKNYITFSNVLITDKDLNYFPRGGEIDIIGISKNGEKIIASCRTKHGSRQVNREITDLNFLLNSLKEFNKAFLFTSKVNPYMVKKANDINVSIIDTRTI